VAQQFLVGGLVFAVCVAIHVFATHLCVRRLAPRISHWSDDNRLVLPMVIVAGTLALAHVAEVALWAGVMGAVGAVADGEALYFAFTSYTTLGYGDVVGTPGWRLLGPMSAMTGILLFGWSTALIVQVLHHALPRDGR
jgi:hypothetical protein